MIMRVMFRRINVTVMDDDDSFTGRMGKTKENLSLRGFRVGFFSFVHPFDKKRTANFWLLTIQSKRVSFDTSIVNIFCVSFLLRIAIMLSGVIFPASLWMSESLRVPFKWNKTKIPRKSPIHNTSHFSFLGISPNK